MSFPKNIIYWILETIAFLATCYLFLLCLYPLVILMVVNMLITKRHEPEKKDKNEMTVGIFHPYCNAGAGGERVLWAIVKALQTNYNNVHIFIYTGDVEHDRETILNNVETIFDFKLKKDNINIVYLRRRKWVEAKTYPVCTLLGQAMGSIWLGVEALTLFKPDVYIDTMGYAFTYPLFKLVGCKVASYTHYPMISMDMLSLVSQRSTTYNNRHLIARNPILTVLKLGYYKGIAFLYGLAGKFADIVMVNSSWTKDHINSIWKCPQRTNLLYPPCDVDKLVKLPFLSDEKKNKKIRLISVSQFRPEKNHALIIEVMNKIKSLINEETWDKVNLILIGSCRNEDDEFYVQKLKSLAKHLMIEDKVEFKLNIPYNQLISELQHGTIGIHAMWNEHFGISVVDALASGLIMIANASGGPKADIIDTKDKTRNGYLAKEIDEYAQTVVSILNMKAGERDAIRNAARKSVDKFSTNGFEREFIKITESFFKLKQR